LIPDRPLGKAFDRLTRERLRMDAPARAFLDKKWMTTATLIVALQANTTLALRTKANAFLALVDLTGAKGPAIEAAKSLALGVRRRR
jgi:hypothetical protein